MKRSWFRVVGVIVVLFAATAVNYGTVLAAPVNPVNGYCLFSGKTEVGCWVLSAQDNSWYASSIASGTTVSTGTLTLTQQTEHQWVCKIDVACGNGSFEAMESADIVELTPVAGHGTINLTWHDTCLLKIFCTAWATGTMTYQVQTASGEQSGTVSVRANEYDLYFSPNVPVLFTGAQS